MEFALKGRYPIDTKEQVKTANLYFTKNLKRFAPADRVLAAVNLEKRANQLGVQINSSWVTNYSRFNKTAAKISPSFEANMNTRRDLTVGMKIEGVDAGVVLDKIASINDENADAKHIIGLVEEFDKLANLEARYDKDCMDPFYTVLGNVDAEYDRVNIVDGITDYSVKRASKNPDTLEKVAEAFGQTTADSFKSKPLNTFLKNRGPEFSVFADIIKGD